ncbi:MAG: sugar phosphate isomerase/epimerase [Prolixibacteraceae bacterium]|nr:sugar phosphate isomerase/epimerase [Prolixibacteraceae bacterium]
MQNLILLFFLIPFFYSSISAQKKETVPEPLEIGYSVGIEKITAEKLKYAKSVNIEYIEVSGMNVLFGDNRNFLLSEAEMAEKFSNVKKWAGDAGIRIWSVHMPYERNIDLSMTGEDERREVVELHKKLLGFCKILNPEIILFHPSYLPGRHERDRHKDQLVKSVRELNPLVRRMKATLVIENMLGYELVRDEKRENPLFRSVDEVVEMMKRMPRSVCSAVDTNHIKNPEKLIDSMGRRLKSVHIADGNGEKECHYLPCSGEGQNDWVVILRALKNARYKGPFMFECAYDDEKQLVDCYHSLHSQAFVN